MRPLILLLVVLSIVPRAAAQPLSTVENHSAIGPDGTRTLELRVVVPAPPSRVWDAVATLDGFRTWAVPAATGEFRLDGVIEASYDPEAKPGGRENVRNRIVAFVPGRMLAMRNEQAPSNAPFDVAAFQSLHTVLFVEPRGENATLVTLVTPGIGGGPALDSVYKHFEWGNRYSLEQLRKRFIDGPVDWEKLRAAMKAKAAK